MSAPKVIALLTASVVAGVTGAYLFKAAWAIVWWVWGGVPQP